MFIELPPLQPVTYELFGGGHDGGIIVIGPGPPYDPPVSIDLTDRCDDGTLVIHHYDCGSCLARNDKRLPSHCRGAG